MNMATDSKAKKLAATRYENCRRADIPMFTCLSSLI